LPSLTKLRDGVLEGPLPAKARWTTSEYVVAEAEDSLETIVQRLSVWSVGYLPDRPEECERIRALHEKGLKELNPGLGEREIAEGTRVKVLSYVDYLGRLEGRRDESSGGQQQEAGTDQQTERE
jgi:hypothetical protein